MSERREVCEHLFQWEQYDNGEPPQNLSDFVRWTQSYLDLVPREYRHTAKIEIDNNQSYDAGYATIHIYYKRPETDEEMAEREGRDRDHAAHELSAQRNQYNKLRVLFGD